MRCRLNDLVMVVRSEVGNEGRIGRIVGRATPGAKLRGGAVCWLADDWIVDGRFVVADGVELSLGGFTIGQWDENRQEVPQLSFPDAWLRPLRGLGPGDEEWWTGEQPCDDEAQPTPTAQPLVSARMVPAYPATLSSLGRALSPLLASAGGGFFF